MAAGVSDLKRAGRKTLLPADRKLSQSELLSVRRQPRKKQGSRRVRSSNVQCRDPHVRAPNETGAPRTRGAPFGMSLQTASGGRSSPSCPGLATPANHYDLPR